MKNAREIAEDVLRPYFMALNDSVLDEQITAAITTAMIAARTEMREQIIKAISLEPGDHAECGHHPDYFDGRADAVHVIRHYVEIDGPDPQGTE